MNAQAQLSELAKAWVALDIQFILTDPGSPACDTATALELQQKQFRLYTNMAILCGMDFNKVTAAIDGNTSGRHKEIRARNDGIMPSYYTENDLVVLKHELNLV